MIEGKEKEINILNIVCMCGCISKLNKLKVSMGG